MQIQAAEAVITAQTVPLELIKCIESLQSPIDFRSSALVTNTKSIREISRKDSMYFLETCIFPPWFIQVLVTGCSDDRFLCSSPKPARTEARPTPRAFNSCCSQVSPQWSFKWFPACLRPKLVKYMKSQFSSQKCNSEEEGKKLRGEKKKSKNLENSERVKWMCSDGRYLPDSAES